jgi:hypothetical protein
MTRSNEVDQLLRECAAVSDKLNNLLTGIHLKTGILMTKTADERVLIVSTVECRCAMFQFAPPKRAALDSPVST